MKNAIFEESDETRFQSNKSEIDDLYKTAIEGNGKTKPGSSTLPEKIPEKKWV